MNVNEAIRNPLLVFPANITIDRDSNQDGPRPITINVNNRIQVYISRSDADDQSPDDQPNMTINDHHPDLTDDEDEDDEDGNGSSQSTSQGSSTTGSSQDSATYATPPTIEQTVQPKLPKTP